MVVDSEQHSLFGRELTLNFLVELLEVLLVLPLAVVISQSDRPCKLFEHLVLRHQFPEALLLLVLELLDQEVRVVIDLELVCSVVSHNS